MQYDTRECEATFVYNLEKFLLILLYLKTILNVFHKQFILLYFLKEKWKSVYLCKCNTYLVQYLCKTARSVIFDRQHVSYIVSNLWILLGRKGCKNVHVIRGLIIFKENASMIECLYNTRNNFTDSIWYRMWQRTTKEISICMFEVH